MTGSGDDKYGRIGGEGRGRIEEDLKGRFLHEGRGEGCERTVRCVRTGRGEDRVQRVHGYG